MGLSIGRSMTIGLSTGLSIGLSTITVLSLSAGLSMIFSETTRSSNLGAPTLSTTLGRSLLTCEN